MTMPDETRYVAAIGPLYNIPLVVTAVAFTAIAWFNGLEMIIMTYTTFKKRSAYFYSLLVCCFGILCYESAIFCLVFARGANAYGITASINTGWSAMVTGQSFVLWSRLHLVCWKRAVLRGVLVMIIVDGILCHGTQWICSMLAIQNGKMNPNFPPFKYAEKVTLCIFFAQEVIISSIYVWQASAVLRSTSLIREKQQRTNGSTSSTGEHRRMRNLILANVVILILDICLLSMEFAALWGVWCTFKGFAYSVKVKIEFAILNQLRGTIGNPNGNAAVVAYPTAYQGVYAAAQAGDGNDAIPLGTQTKASASPHASRRNNHVASNSGDHDKITITTSYAVSRSDQQEDDSSRKNSRRESDSPTSSEIQFATKGV